MNNTNDLDNVNKENPEGKNHKYIGNRIPFFIKLAWIILALWICYYIAAYVIPDWKLWMGKP